MVVAGISIARVLVDRSCAVAVSEVKSVAETDVAVAGSCTTGDVPFGAAFCVLVDDEKSLMSTRDVVVITCAVSKTLLFPNDSPRVPSGIGVSLGEVVTWSAAFVVCCVCVWSEFSMVPSPKVTSVAVSDLPADVLN